MITKNPLKSLSISNIFPEEYNIKLLKNLVFLEEINFSLDCSYEDDLKNYGRAFRSLKNLKKLTLNIDYEIEIPSYMIELSQIEYLKIRSDTIPVETIIFLFKFLNNNINLRSLKTSYTIYKGNTSLFDKYIDAVASHPNLKHFKLGETDNPKYITFNQKILN